MIFRVWDPDDTSEGGARSIEASTVSGAARRFAEQHDADDWTDAPRTYHVRAENDELVAVTVFCSMEPVFGVGGVERIEQPSDTSAKEGR